MPIKPSEQENEYFAKLEIQKRLKEQAKRAQAVAEEEKKRLQELHHMHCPNCGMQLQETVLKEVTVDICPGCQGVWFDEGELAKLTGDTKGVFSFIRGVFS